MSSRLSTKKTAPKTGSRVPSEYPQPSSSQKLFMAGSKLFGRLKQSGAPSVKSSSHKLGMGSHKSTRHIEREARKTKSSVPASLPKSGSAIKLSSMERLRSNSKHNPVANHSPLSKKKSTVPPVPLSAAKIDLVRSTRSNCKSHVTEIKGLTSMAKSGIPTKGSGAINGRPTSSNKRTKAPQSGRSVHIHHHHHIVPSPARAQYVVMQERCGPRSRSSVQCQFCRCDIDDMTYSEKGCCFDCGTTRGYCD